MAVECRETQAAGASNVHDSREYCKGRSTYPARRRQTPGESLPRVWFYSLRAGRQSHNLAVRLAPPHGYVLRPLQYSLLSWTLLAPAAWVSRHSTAIRESHGYH